jgi:signal transduction histidine kinase
MTPVDLRPLVAKVALLEQRTSVDVVAGPDVTIPADVDQIEQVLINLVKNAADAALTNSDSKAKSQGSVRISWKASDRFVEIAIEDDGPGIGDTANLFVPFFTTKPDGSGIGLVLCREIVDAHHGQMSLSSRTGGHGAVARVRLPLDDAHPPQSRRIASTS